MARYKKNLDELVLVLNGAEQRLQVILGIPAGDESEVVAIQEWTVPGESVRFIVPTIENMISSLDVPITNIKGIACTVGPGSFTGLRLVLAAAEGLAAAHNIPKASLPYLETLAAGPLEFTPHDLYAITHARRGQVYIQGFSAEAGVAITQPHALKLEEVPQFINLSKKTEGSLLFGSGVRKYPDFFESLLISGMEFAMLPPHWDNPKADLLLELAALMDYSDDPLEPMYLRGSDAEENLPQIAEKRGIDLDEAREMISRPAEESIVR